jgi:N6-adenosine-specific RNA methylase IME4
MYTELKSMIPNQNSAILYQSVDGEITLIDIPRSIAQAQGRADTLLSTTPLEEPIQTKEEYQPKAGNTTGATLVDLAHHETYKGLIEQALLDIKAHVPGSWCAPRNILPQPHRTGRDAASNDTEKELEGRFREWAAVDEGTGDETSFDFNSMMASLGAPEVQPATTTSQASRWKISTSPHQGAAPQTPLSMDWSTAFHNAHAQPLDLTIIQTTHSPGQEPPAYHFTLPPLSSFFLSDCDHPDSFRTSFRSLTNTHNLPRHFDLVLLDPPWPNRSAKRKGAYEQLGGMPYLKKMLMKMDIETYLEHNALVGVWITNKPALREHVLGPGGLFETWNVGLCEEWVWVKTTTNGQPMFSIDDAMRKPYEILLLGRASPNSWTRMTHAERPLRRVVAAVPDVHSRKPCLKELLEPYMPQREYTALEVFARYVVEGWTAWGNEVLKYNAKMYWAEKEDVQLWKG